MPVTARPLFRIPVDRMHAQGVPLKVAIVLVLGAGVLPAKPQGALAVALDAASLSVLASALLAAVTYLGYLMALTYQAPGRAVGPLGAGCLRWSNVATWALLGVASLRAVIVVASLPWS